MELDMNEKIASYVESYQEYHDARFQMILATARQLKPDATSVVLDVGPGPLTAMLRSHYRQVHTLGFEQSRIFPASRDSFHYEFDLRNTEDNARWIKLSSFDLIIFSEVIEHVYARPSQILRFLASGIAAGGVIVCSTPNLLAFHKRLRMILGRPPFDRWASGHYTEFTRHELERFAGEAGLEVRTHRYLNYFGCLGSPLAQRATKFMDAVTGVVPSLRRGQLIVLGKPLSG
jgi:2-polyprenyl-3-methyl-5-hydroxy-6-metoxy-1,4-benzoquinol methylase